MATFIFNGKTFYIDGRLSHQLETKIISQLKTKDKDAVFVVDGDERIGKSVFAMLLGSFVSSLLGSRFDLSCVCLTPEEFRNKVMEAPKNSVVIYDEAHRGMASARSLSEVNNILKDLMMEMGQRNLFIIIVIPTIFLLDRYAALFRTKGLFHIYEKKGQRGYWCYFNKKYKLYLYQRGKRDLNYNCMKWPYFRGRFLDQYPLDEKEYRAKKASSFQEKKRITKAEVWMAQRDKIIGIIHKNWGLGSPSIAKLFKNYGLALHQRQIGEILANFDRTYDDNTGTGDATI